jgi:hypothetical protein
MITIVKLDDCQKYYLKQYTFFTFSIFRFSCRKIGWSSRTENPADLKSSRFVNPADLIRVSAGFQRQRISTLANKRLPDFYFFHFLFFAKNQNSFRKVWREQFLQFSRLWFPKRTRAGNKSIIILILLGSKISSF